MTVLSTLPSRWRRISAVRWAEFGVDGAEQDGDAARIGSRLRELESDLLDAQRTALIRLHREGKVDNTVMRRVQRLLDLQAEETELLASTGHSDIDDNP